MLVQHIPYRLARTHPNATRAIADGNISDADDAVDGYVLLVNTIADLGLIGKPSIFSDFLSRKKNPGIRNA